MSNAGKRVTKTKPHSTSPNKVMVFGVFDRLHPGHVSFFEQARRYGDITAVVMRNSVGHALKGKKPSQHEQLRLLSVKGLDFVANAVLGDEKQGAYSVLKDHKPDIICLGYDQESLREDLSSRIKQKMIPNIKLVTLKPYFPEKFHTSLLDS